MKPELLYRDICRGFSEIQWRGIVYVKHLDVVEFNSLSEVYDAALERAKGLGCKTEATLTQEAIERGEWTALKERSIKSYDEDIALIEASKKKILHKDQINSIYDSVLELQKKKMELLIEKYAFLNNSVEAYANHALREQQIFLSCYKDAACNIKYFEEDFEYFKELPEFAAQYAASDLTNESLKKICIAPFFWTLFNLSEQPYNFFGIPLCKLTNNQASLLKYAQTYAKVASECTDLPPEFEGNCDKMLMWFFLRRNGGMSDEEEKQEQQKTANKFRAALNTK